ncbi:hypothetical protein EDB85DRAFT_87980 [Lactarius pseudohatsudake]|nr:hypothetical protein EDB85DRAFT_87980 [Lactarius pseudohatsudake]
MPSFLRKFKHSQNLDIKDMPSLTMNLPSTIFSISQFFILIFRYHLPHLRGLGLLLVAAHHPSSQRPWATRADHFLHRFPRITFLSAHIQDVPTDVITQCTVLLLNAPHPRPHTQLTHIPAPPTESAHAPPAPSPPQRTIVSMQLTVCLTAGAPEPLDPALACLAQRPAFPAAHPRPRLERFSAARALPYAQTICRRRRRMRRAANWRATPRGPSDDACAARLPTSA